MNNLTKEELEELSAVLSSHINSYGDDETRILLIPIFEKLEEIVDNYCKHEKDVWPLYTAQGDLPSAGMCYECDSPVDRKFINE